MRENRTAARPGSAERFEQPKLLVGDTGSGIRAMYDGDHRYVKDVLIVLDRQRSQDQLRTVAALLNSRAVRYYYETSFPTIHVQNNELAQLPIPTIGEEERARLSELAEQCQEVAQTGDEARLQTLEAEIDQIVYRLFDLTPEEIALIENSVPRT